MFLSCTTEKREVSSTNNLGLEDKSSNKSLIYIKENSWPRIDPWGTPAFISSHFLFFTIGFSQQNRLNVYPITYSVSLKLKDITVITLLTYCYIGWPMRQLRQCFSMCHSFIDTVQKQSSRRVLWKSCSYRRDVCNFI